MLEVRELSRPYPGLRPFQPHELPVFFGREAHVSRLIEVMARQRFVAVIGPSGAGKSSLVHAGFLPALSLGWTGDVSDWRIASLRPGEQPLRRLAEALLEPEVLGPLLGRRSAELDIALRALIEAELRRGPRALVDLMADAQLQGADRPPFNLLVLVDQFEELFRYVGLGAQQVDEAEAFVNLLLLPRLDAAPSAARIHVAITMRTDAMHECARFLDLPEAINCGQYLVPRLKPDELRSAIVGPARVFEGQVQPAVVESLLARVQETPDQLPLLQHVLACMWDSASARDSRHPQITPQDLSDTDGVDGALSRHANRIFDSLAPDEQALADLLFRAITEQDDAGQRDARHPQTLGTISRFSGLAESDWPRFVSVLRAFAVEGANFVQFTEPLSADTVVDISHEALIRQWNRLHALADWEASLAMQYRRWRDRSEQHLHNGGELLNGADLVAALAWQRGQTAPPTILGSSTLGGVDVSASAPHAGWAARYALSNIAATNNAEFEALLAFIEISQKEEKRRQTDIELADAAQQREARMLLAAELLRSETTRASASPKAAEHRRTITRSGSNESEHVTVALVQGEPDVASNIAGVIGNDPRLRLMYSCSTAIDMMRWLGRNKVDVLVVDLSLPDRPGIDVITLCHTLQPTCDVMVLTILGDEAHMVQAFEAGARGYLLRDGIEGELANHLIGLHEGGAPMSPIIAGQLLTRWQQGAQSSTGDPAHTYRTAHRLSPRELEILQLVAQGYKHREVAMSMGISVTTVQSHVRNIYAKLDVQSKAEALFEARQLGLLD